MTETYPYYRLTKWLKKESDLDEWFDWFVSLGTPVCITQNDTLGKCALWVTGEESIDDPNKLDYHKKKTNVERMTGWIVKQSDDWGGIKLGLHATS